MNFFAHQEQARAQTRRTLWLFALAVVAVIALLDAVVFLAFASHSDWRDALPFMGLISVLFLGIIAVASIYKVISLREGGGAIARSLGGTRIDPSTQDPSFRRLVNVVEEMAIAAGMTCPEIYVLERESAINAFAAGYTVADAAVTVTRGALQKLSRDELQGVIAHEFSHILNGDMRLNIRLLGVLFGLMVIGEIGREIMLAGRNDRKGSGLAVFGIALLLIGFAGLFFGRLIKASISRSREFDADATAVQFTRISDGIAGALKKVGGFVQGSGLKHRKTEDVAHMLFADGKGRWLATHPELSQRIIRLDPNFTPAQFAHLRRVEPKEDAQLGVLDEPLAAFQLLGLAPLANNTVLNTQAAVLKTMQARAQQVSDQVARPELAHMQYAQNMRQALPANLRAAALSRLFVMDLIFLLALSDAATHRQAQLALLRQRQGDLLVGRVVSLAQSTASALRREQKLPLASLAFQALKLLEKAQRDACFASLTELVHLDGVLDLYEFCLVSMLEQFLVEADAPAQASGERRKLQDVKGAILTVLSTFAACGHRDEKVARAAFAAGVVTIFADAAAPYQPSQDFAGELAQSIALLDSLAAFGKHQLIAALVTTLNFDGQIEAAEAELLRVICLRLHCPLPPLLAFAV
jgi:Zn-dependent protease with chaperone function